jgi:hypothetical protein
MPPYPNLPVGFVMPEAIDIIEKAQLRIGLSDKVEA